MKKKLLPHHQYFYDRAKDRIEHKIEVEETKVHGEDAVFEVRCDIIQAAFAAHNDLIKYLKTNFPDELRYSKENLFPTKWMLKDEQIHKAMDRRPHFELFLNYLHNHNRYARGEELKKIQAEVKKISEGKSKHLDGFLEDMRDEATVRKVVKLLKGIKHKDEMDEEKYDDLWRAVRAAEDNRQRKGKPLYLAYISFFIGNADFYDKFRRETKIPMATIRRYIYDCVEIGNVKKLYDGGKSGTIYADGWFQQMPDNRLRKLSFLKNTPEIIEGLRKLAPSIRKPNAPTYPYKRKAPLDEEEIYVHKRRD